MKGSRSVRIAKTTALALGGILLVGVAKGVGVLAVDWLGPAGAATILGAWLLADWIRVKRPPSPDNPLPQDTWDIAEVIAAFKDSHGVSKPLFGHYVDDRHRAVTPAPPWTLVLDVPQDAVYRHARVRALFVALRPLHLSVYQGSSIDRVGTIVGAHDVSIGDPEFDRVFVVKAIEASTASAVLTPELRQRFVAKPDLILEIGDAPRLPAHPDERHLQMISLHTDEGRCTLEGLSDLHRIVSLTLDRLCDTGVAAREDPVLSLLSGREDR